MAPYATGRIPSNANDYGMRVLSMPSGMSAIHLGFRNVNSKGNLPLATAEIAGLINPYEVPRTSFRASTNYTPGSAAIKVTRALVLS